MNVPRAPWRLQRLGKEPGKTIEARLWGLHWLGAGQKISEERIYSSPQTQALPKGSCSLTFLPWLFGVLFTPKSGSKGCLLLLLMGPQSYPVSAGLRVVRRTVSFRGGVAKPRKKLESNK